MRAVGAALDVAVLLPVAALPDGGCDHSAIYQALDAGWIVLCARDPQAVVLVCAGVLGLGLGLPGAVAIYTITGTVALGSVKSMIGHAMPAAGMASLIKTALALGCTVNRLNRFARKHYYYPDMPKNYQISQYDEPIAFEGSVEVELPDGRLLMDGGLTNPADIAAEKRDLKTALAALDAKGLHTELVPPRYRTSYFRHIWGGGYAAGYYAYSWTEMLDHDAYAWFKENGGMTRANGQHLRDTILSKGHSQDYSVMYQNFAGRQPSVEPMLKARGLK